MTDVIRWGVLGVAGINAAMVPAIRACAGAELVGIASRDEGGPGTSRRPSTLDPYVGYDALLADPTIDAVYLPTPNAQHAPWTLRAVAAGKHVLCEKPLAVTAGEAREMADAAAAAGVHLAEAFMYAHHPRYHLVRRLIADGAIGDIRSIHVTFTFDASGELGHSGFQGAPGSGAIYDVGCYAVHVARTLIGAEPEAVTAHAMSSLVARRHRHEHLAAPRVSRRGRRNRAAGHVERRSRHGDRHRLPWLDRDPPRVPLLCHG